jgi:hypothetical protein
MKVMKTFFCCLLLVCAGSCSSDSTQGGQKDIVEVVAPEDTDEQDLPAADLPEDDAISDADEEVATDVDGEDVEASDADEGDADGSDDSEDTDTQRPEDGEAEDLVEDITEDTEPVDNGLEPLDDIKGPGKPPFWLLSIDNGTKMLQKVNIESGKATDICKLKTPDNTGLPNKYSYPSLTFSRSNLLFASRGGIYLDVIDPCTCKVTGIGDYGIWNGVNGITSDQGTQLMGASSNQDELIAIATKTGQGTTIGKLGVDFTTHGATWSDVLGGLYAINGSTDALYVIDPDTGAAAFKVALDMDFFTVGIELLPANNVIYACSTASILLKVNPESGHVTEIGPMGQKSSCTNLAAPWAPVPCLDNK